MTHLASAQVKFRPGYCGKNIQANCRIFHHSNMDLWKHNESSQASQLHYNTMPQVIQGFHFHLTILQYWQPGVQGVLRHLFRVTDSITIRRYLTTDSERPSYSSWNISVEPLSQHLWLAFSTGSMSNVRHKTQRYLSNFPIFL